MKQLGMVKNNTGSVGKVFRILAILTFIGLIFYLFFIVLTLDYKQYKSFCNERADFCYCSWGDCHFKSQWSSLSGLSNDTKELCELATELQDKETLFRVGCYNGEE